MRVITLLPAATDIVCALGAGDALVGVSHECDAAGMPAHLPRVTRRRVNADGEAGTVDRAVRELHPAGAPLFELDEAAIASARPDLIITQGIGEVCAVNEGDVRAVAARLVPSPRILTLSARTLEDVLLDIAHVARALDSADEAEELLAGLRSRMRDVHVTLKTAAAPRPLVAVIEWTAPVVAAGHWVPDMVKRAGGLDALAQAGGHSLECPPRVVHDASPGILVIAPCGYGLERAAAAGRALLASDEWRWVQGRPVWAVDANRLVSRPSLHLIDGIEVMARMFNPSLFSPLTEGRAIKLA